MGNFVLNCETVSSKVVPSFINPEMLRMRQLPELSVDILLEFCSKYDQLSCLVKDLEDLKFGTPIEPQLQCKVQVLEL